MKISYTGENERIRYLAEQLFRDRADSLMDSNLEVENEKIEKELDLCISLAIRFYEKMDAKLLEKNGK